ncbi:MAG: hypothetical protein ABIG20_04155 [archaeon]
MKAKVGLFILAIIIIAAVFLILSNQPNLPKEEGKTWVDKHLTQCAEDWQMWGAEKLYSHLDNLIKDFYEEEHGITIYSVHHEEARGDACEACTCLAPVRLFLQIANEDADKMEALGYNR